MTTTKENINTLLKEDTKTLRDKLLTILAEKSYKEGKFILTSGNKSNYYIDSKMTTLHPQGGVITSILFLRLLKENVTNVGGIVVGACPLASGVSQIGFLLGKNLSSFYIRKEPKKHGTNKWVEGPIKEGEKVAILEDVVTMGGSSLKAIEKITEYGCKVEQVLAIVDRNEGGKELFKQKGIQYSYIFEIKDLTERHKIL